MPMKQRVRKGIRPRITPQTLAMWQVLREIFETPTDLNEDEPVGRRKFGAFRRARIALRHDDFPCRGLIARASRIHAPQWSSFGRLAQRLLLAIPVDGCRDGQMKLKSVKV